MYVFMMTGAVTQVRLGLRSACKGARAVYWDKQSLEGPCRHSLRYADAQHTTPMLQLQECTADRHGYALSVAISLEQSLCFRYFT